MKRILHKTLCLWLSASLVWMPVWWQVAKAEDIDLFVANTAGAPNPNILVIIDNSANWSNAAQHWPGGVKQGQSELRALKTAVNELRPTDSSSSQVNLGLMMFTEGQGSDLSGGYVRYAIRPMTQTNVDGLAEIIGDDTCVDGSVTVGTSSITKCIFKNFDDTFEKVGTSNTDYSAAMFEAFKYFGGYTDVAHATGDVAGVPPTGAVSPHTFGTARRAGTIPSDQTSRAYKKFDGAAFTDATKSTYSGPITTASSCAKNYIIFIGNGFPASEPTAWDTELLFNVNQASTQQAMPNFTTTVATTTTTLGSYSTCSTATACATAAASTYGSLYDTYACSGGTTATSSTQTVTSCMTNAACDALAETTFPTAVDWSCTGGTSTYAASGALTDNTCYTANECEKAAATLVGGSDHACGTGTTTGTPACSGSRQKNRPFTYTASCGTGTLINQTMVATFGSTCTTGLSGQTISGTKTVATVTPTGTFSVPTSAKTRYADEWAKFLATTDVSAIAGQQTVVTYTIDVFLDAQDADQTALLQSMARYGGGKYYSASSESAILHALREILIEIQSVNTVFAAASLPINATNRSQNENQVFIGMFRPDSGGRPRWYGNLKRYQIALFAGEAKLADADGNEAVSSATGFVAPCSRSFYTVDTGDYWNFIQPGVTSFAGLCTTAGTSLYSDKPDGAQVEKGAVAEMLRLGNNPGTSGYTDSSTTPTPETNFVRTMYTCLNSNTTATFDNALVTCNTGSTAMHELNTTNVPNRLALGSSVTDDTERTNIINFTLGRDFSNDQPNQNFNTCGGVQCISDVRPDVHGDVAHSRPLPVNYGGTTGVVLYYGANDATFRAVKGNTGQELWSFVAPEHHSRLERLRDNSPRIKYSGSTDLTLSPKDYFFDGSAGLYQTFNSDGTSNTAWIFPSMRRGGRMLYGFNVTAPTSPRMLWRIGCPNLTDDTGCSTNFENIGQTWSIPAVAKIKGYNLDGSGVEKPVIIVGGGYDTCEDNDDAATTCGTNPKGSSVYVLDAETGNLLRRFGTGDPNGTSIERSVASDMTLVDRSFLGFAQHAYFVDTGGALYRIDFVTPSTQASITNANSWALTKIAYTAERPATTSNLTEQRKFLFAPAALATASQVFLTMGTGDRERPLITNYPYVDNVQNRFYMFKDNFSNSNIDLDGSQLTDLTSDNTCSAAVETNDLGWRIDLNAGRGEQTVTSSTIFGGLVFFSTNRPLDSSTVSCANSLGEARGYAVNLLNASGAVGTEGICGGERSNTFVGGGLPPSPVTGTVPVNGNPVTVMIGGVQRTGASSSPIGAQKVKPVIAQKRTRIYWYKHGDK